jgi:hypothetical protein
MKLLHAQHHRPHRLHCFDRLRHQRDELGHQGVQSLQLRKQILEVVSHGVDAVERVEERPHRPADRDVVAVRLPVQVVAERPEEVIEIGDVIA